MLTSVYLRPQSIPLLDGDILRQAATSEGVKYAAPIAFGDNWQGHPIIGTIADFASRGGRGCTRGSGRQRQPGARTACARGR